MTNQPGSTQKIQLITDAQIAAGTEALQPGAYQKEHLDNLLAVIAEAENQVDVIPVSGATQTLDVDAYAAFEVTLTAGCTFTFGAPLEDFEVFELVLIQDGVGGHAVVWPGSVEWTIGAPPVLGVGIGNKSILIFSTIDGGTTWFGNLVGDAIA